MKKSCKLGRLMLDFDNQRGFATIEIILVVMIISVLATVAVPQMARMVDVAQVDYEMKILLSQLDYAYSLDKNSHYSPQIFNVNLSNDTGHNLQINIDESLNRYTIMQNGENFSEPHKLPQGFSIACESGLPNQIISGNSYSGHITITSRYNVKRYVISNSVGRWRGDINPPK